MTWQIEPGDGNFNSDYKYILNAGYTAPEQWGYFAINTNAAVQVTFTAIVATNSVSGRLTDNYGNPMGDIEMSADATINGTFYHLYQINTDGGGNYRINLCNGSWTVSLDNYSGQFDEPPLSNYIWPADTNLMILNNSFVVNFMATLISNWFVLSSPQFAAGKTNFNFQYSGPAGSNCVLQVSTNLWKWSSVKTSTIPVNGVLNLTNDIKVFDRCFYRVYLQ